MESRTVELKSPVEIGGVKYSAYVVDEPTVEVVEAYEKAIAEGATQMGAMVAMMSAASGWPVEVIRKIKISDMTRIGEAFSPFVEAMTPAGGVPGAASSPSSPAG